MVILWGGPRGEEVELVGRGGARFEGVGGDGKAWLAWKFQNVQRAHLFDLARTVPAAVPAHTAPDSAAALRTSLQRVLDSMTVPAVAYNAQQDLVAFNLLEERCSRHTSRRTDRTWPASSSSTSVPGTTTPTGRWRAA